MTDILFKSISIATLPIELFASTLLYCHPLRHRNRYRLRVLLAGAVAALAEGASRISACFLGGIPAGTAKGILPFVLVYSFVSYLFAVLLAFSCCALSWPEAIYCATCAYLTQHFTLCLHLLLSPGVVEDDFSTYTLWYFVIYGLSYWGAEQFIARRLTTDGGYRTGLGQSLQLTASALAVALVISAVSQQFRAESTWLYRLCRLYGASCCFFVLWGQLSQQRQLNLQHELELQQQLWLKNKAQYDLSAKNVDLINRKCHDLKHQVAALKLISDQAKRDEQIRSLEQSVMIYDSMIKTGNEILDTVLTEKSLLCEEKEIKLTCVADGACLDFMDAVDLYTIFGNALDNAIESVNALKDPGEKSISLQVFSQAGMVLIQTENYCSGPLRFEDGLPATSKAAEPGFHGFGLKSIRYTVEKYDGFLTVRQEGNTFLLRATIPQY